MTVGGEGREERLLMSERNTSQLPRLLCCTREKERETPRQQVAGEKERRWAALAGQARVIRRSGRGAGSNLGERAGSVSSRADNRGRSRRTGGAEGDHFTGGEEAANCGRAGGQGVSAIPPMSSIVSISPALGGGGTERG